MALLVFKRIGWVFLVLCGIIPFVAIIVLLLVHPASGSSTSEFNWLSVISAVVGAIGAVGGIVVGMISLITLTQIDKQVKAAFDERYQEHQRSLDEQSKSWASGVKLWAQASMMDDLDHAAATLERGLEMWPTAPNARTDMLLRIYDPTERAYLLDLIPERRKILEGIDAMQSARSGPVMNWPQSYLNQCIEWLTLAQTWEYEENAIQLDYTGSKISAMTKSFNKALERLEKYVAADGTHITEWDILVWASSAQTIQDLVKLKKVISKSPYNQPAMLGIDEVISAMKKRLHTASNGHCQEQYLLFTPNMFSHFQRLIDITYAGDKWGIQFLPLYPESNRLTYESDDELRNAFSPNTLVGPIPDPWSLRL